LSREYPFAQRDLAALHDGTNGDGERLAAVLALVDAGAGALALQLGDAIFHDATARAYRAIRPQDAFQVLTSLVVVVVDRMREIDFRYVRFLPIDLNIRIGTWYVNQIVPRMINRTRVRQCRHWYKQCEEGTGEYA
jgi:hypothetical protein